MNLYMLLQCVIGTSSNINWMCGIDLWKSSFKMWRLCIHIDKIDVTVRLGGELVLALEP